MKKHTLAVYIGRFQPFHVGHKHAVQQTLEQSHNLLILVGSAYGPRTTKNPWTYEERASMIRMSLTPAQQNKVTIKPISDYKYDDNIWITQVQDVVSEVKDELSIKQYAPVLLAGHQKDETTYYLKIFPQWDNFEISYLDLLGSDNLDATKIRELWFENQRPYIASVVNPDVLDYMLQLETEVDKLQELKKEYDFIKIYKKSWEAAPYAPIFSTVDAVVIQSGHILLVRRGAAPGKGLWAIPGGFVNQKERLEDAMLRELKEETKIKLQASVLRRCITEREIFDDPNRSDRGRTITTAYLIELEDQQPLPKVTGSDDADKAKWFTFAEFADMQENLYEDHFHIINHFIKVS